MNAPPPCRRRTSPGTRGDSGPHQGPFAHPAVPSLGLFLSTDPRATQTDGRRGPSAEARVSVLWAPPPNHGDGRPRASGQIPALGNSGPQNGGHPARRVLRPSRPDPISPPPLGAVLTFRRTIPSPAGLSGQTSRVLRKPPSLPRRLISQLGENCPSLHKAPTGHPVHTADRQRHRGQRNELGSCTWITIPWPGARARGGRRMKTVESLSVAQVQSRVGTPAR